MSEQHNSKNHESHEKQGDESQDHHRMMMKDFKRRFYVSLVITAPLLILSPTIQGWVGYDLTFPGFEFVLLALATFIFFYGGWPFLKGIYNEITDKKPGMMTLIAVAISVAYFYSAAVVIGLRGSPFFWELATLIDVMLLGHWIEMRSVIGASRALEKLVELMPSEAHRKTNDGIEDVPLDALNKGDTVIV